MPQIPLVRNVRALRTTALVLAVLGIFQAASSRYGKTFWVNLTASEPIGIYRLHMVAGEVERGDLVLMEVPPEFHRYVYGRRWLPDGWPLMKHVGAVAGDIFCVNGSSFAINGRALGPAYRADAQGLPLPRLDGCRAIPPGHFLPVALRIKRSFDGRYMGPVAVTKIRGRLSPILTAR